MFPEPAAPPVKKVHTLNALRGFSALFVVFYHMVAYGKFLDPGYLPTSFKYFFDMGHFRILIFFVISGAVISLSNKTNLTLKTVPEYLKKRMLRIYPIYALSLVLTLFIVEKVYSFYTVAGNFTFLHVLVTDVILENGPIWTLHYEIVFYLLFIPLSIYNADPLKIAIVSFLIGILNYFLFPYLHTPIITSYAFGFTFWAMGMIIVKYFTKQPNSAFNYTRLVSFLFLLICIPYLNGIENTFYFYSMKHFGHYFQLPYYNDMNQWFKIAFGLLDFAHLPYCFMAVILFSGRNIKYKNILLFLLLLLPALTIYGRLKLGTPAQIEKIIFPICCYVMCLILCFIDFPFLAAASKKVINFLIWMGGISYGTYIIHVPVLILFSKVDFFSGSKITFFVRMILYFAVTYSLAYLLENTYQNWVLRMIKTKKSKTVAAPEKTVVVNSPD